METPTTALNLSIPHHPHPRLEVKWATTLEMQEAATEDDIGPGMHRSTFRSHPSEEGLLDADCE